MVNPSPKFWRGRRVLLTGHTGFKGAWLMHWLRLLGAEVTGLALAPATKPNLAVMSGLVDPAISSLGDIRDGAAVEAEIERYRPEIVLHLAAQALVRRSYRDPLESFATNVMGTLNVLAAASRCVTTRAVLVVTTDKCYENREWLWAYRENEPLGGRDPYSASKACAEIATAAWRSSLPDMTQYGRAAPLAIASARAGNVFGGGDWAEDRLVPDFFRTVAQGGTLAIRNPAAQRPWQHVLEPLVGYLLLAERLFDGEAQEAWNFGPDPVDVIPVGDLVARLTALVPGSTWECTGDGSQPHEAGLLALDSAKARTQLGWRPRLPIDAALEWTVQWYQRAAVGADPEALVHDQIVQYTALGVDR
ncbi:CDP-glucose 4,6-dehydratase [Novosphingobium sp. LASN5T]|uniref:CDP-glucose 4,6-dehydratase n=1 Tax=Novosphingobium sp. LASN5T TaxID=2491021 RepID=UPI000F5E614D|nr:CDP-glucose 4,6-dehydratase [Novosphingobium sp. LASN5T]RQW37690.1 CDP-glucose 4,6-dehydratase [Novosphingobium sp. LASN5T]